MDVTTILQTELDAVTGEQCGWTCEHHGDNFPPCQRAMGHVGADRMVDVHVSRYADGGLVTATEQCCATATAETAEEAVPVAA